MKDILTVIFRRKWHAVAFFCFMVAVPMSLAYIIPPKYEATAKLLITPGRFKKAFLPEEKDTRTTFLQVTREDVGSEVELLLSSPVLHDVVDKNRLDREHPPQREEFLKYMFHLAKKAFSRFLDIVGIREEDVPLREKATTRLRNSLEVVFRRGTTIFHVSWRGTTPEQARDVINTLVDAYLQHHIRIHGNTSATDAVRRQMDESHERLIEAENRLNEFKSLNSISEVDTQHQETLKKLAGAENNCRILRNVGQEGLSISELGNLAGDPAFFQLWQRFTDAKLRRIELSSRYNERERPITAIDHEIEEIDALIKERFQSTLSTWVALANSYREQLNELDQAKIGIERLNREIIEVQRRYHLNREKYEELLISGAMDQASVTSVRVVEYAVLSSKAAFPNKSAILIVSLFLGSVGGLAYAFMWDKLSTRVTSVSDVEALTGAPVLASIPQFSKKERADLDSFESEITRALIPFTEILSQRDAGELTSVLLTASSCGVGNRFVLKHIAELLAKSTGKRSLCVLIEHAPEISPARDEGSCISDPNKLKEILGSLSSDEQGTREVDGFVDYLTIDVSDKGVVLWENRVHELIANVRQTDYRYMFLGVSTHRANTFYLKFVPFVDDVVIVVGYDITSKHSLLRMLELTRRYKGNVAGCILNRRRNVIPDFIYNLLF